MEQEQGNRDESPFSHAEASAGESYRGMFYDLCVEPVPEGGFRVQAIIWEDEGDCLIMHDVVGGTNVVVDTRALAQIVARSLSRKWIDEKWEARRKRKPA
jgi:hypothetical protein